MYSKPRRFFLLLIFVSLLSLAIHLYTAPRSIAGRYVQPSVSESKPKKAKEKFAYATFLGPPTSRNASAATDAELQKDPYFISVRLLNHQILHATKTKTKIKEAPFLVLVLPAVPRIWIEHLKKEGATVISIQPLDVPDAFDKDFIKNSRFRDVLSKLRLWELTDYDKILYLDADSFLLQNLDGLFTNKALSMPMQALKDKEPSWSDEEHIVPPPNTYLMAASTDTYGPQLPWEDSIHAASNLDPHSPSPSLLSPSSSSPEHKQYLCACFMLISPSIPLFKYYTHILRSADAPENAAYPEQDLLIWAHRPEGPMPWKRIGIEWSANDGEMDTVMALKGGVKSLHVKGWDGAEGGNVAGDVWKERWRGMVADMERFYEGVVE
ncbi:glycosyltransferase family 8 protein [Amniculicola lignicola CBS 123094]|uniref:Glycosyltransferase family 8 protein n=1 Tax=Amniculicola lignicola CBS 123094 TaxID=1392246 RepID=A0A6A5W920_9PLEO|nr:glycosyltransferase family 8 protein [Amniculicola lignicola CBS 123094]